MSSRDDWNQLDESDFRRASLFGAHATTLACLSEGRLSFVGAYGAPGYGQAWKCDVCDHPFTKIGDAFYDATTHVFELSPEDVV